MEATQDAPRLAEVKKILMNLQRIDLTAETAGDETVVGVQPLAGKAPYGAPDAMRVFDRKHSAMAPVKPGKNSKRIVAYSTAIAAVAAVAILLAVNVIHVRHDEQKVEPAILALHEENETAVVTEARGLLNSGSVALARDRLLSVKPERHAEVALMLAQSYDPNYLRSLPKANSVPDRSEAERWYKKWYELAVLSGLEMDSGRLQRIINAMR